MDINNVDRVWRYKPIADSLGISTKTLQRLVARGAITTVQISDRIKSITESERRRFIEVAHRWRMTWRDHLKIHPAADLFPMMSESELRELGEDIKENGQRIQVVLWKDPSPGGEYWLIDGRNRLDAMELAGLCVFDKIGRQRFFWRLMDGDHASAIFISLNANSSRSRLAAQA